MGRPRRSLALSAAEIVDRYRAGESLESLASACGTVSYAPIRTILVENDVAISPAGGRKNAKHRLSNIDPDRRRGDCAECGPDTPIRPRSAAERGSWRCDPPGKDRRGKGARVRTKARARLKKYGLTPEALTALTERQGDRCAICMRPPNVGARLDVDHCHISGKIRALLCRHCNTGLGLFGDDPERLVLAANYLRQHAD